MHDLARLYADHLSEEHPQADGPEQARDRRAAHCLDITGAAMLRVNPSDHGGGSPQSGSAVCLVGSEAEGPLGCVALQWP